MGEPYDCFPAEREGVSFQYFGGSDFFENNGREPNLKTPCSHHPPPTLLDRVFGILWQRRIGRPSDHEDATEVGGGGGGRDITPARGAPRIRLVRRPRRTPAGRGNPQGAENGEIMDSESQ